MRILYLTHNTSGKGGGFVRCHSMARYLARRGHEMTILSGSAWPALRSACRESDGVKLWEPPDWMPFRWRHGGLSVIDIISRFRIVRKGQFDLIHGFCHRPSVSLPVLLQKSQNETPVIFDWADLWGKEGIADERPWWEKGLGALDQAMETWAYSRPDGLSVINGDLKDRALELGISADCLHMLPPIAEVDRIRPLSKSEMRKRRGIPLDASVAVHAGFSPFDSFYMAEAVRIWMERDPRALLVLCGGGFLEIIRRMRRQGMEKRVIHFGFVPAHHLEEILACGDVMLLPYTDRSLNHGRFPNKFCDFLASGRPVVTNRTGEIGPLVEKEGVGIAAESSVEAFAGAIQILAEQPEMAGDMGKRARRLAEERFSGDKIAESLERFYQRIIQNGRISGGNGGRR